MLQIFFSLNLSLSVWTKSSSRRRFWGKNAIAQNSFSDKSKIFSEKNISGDKIWQSLRRRRLILKKCFWESRFGHSAIRPVPPVWPIAARLAHRRPTCNVPKVWHARTNNLDLTGLQIFKTRRKRGAGKLENWPQFEVSSHPSTSEKKYYLPIHLSTFKNATQKAIRYISASGWGGGGLGGKAHDRWSLLSRYFELLLNPGFEGETRWSSLRIVSTWYLLTVSVTALCENLQLWHHKQSLRQFFHSLFSLWENFGLCFWANIHFCKWPNIEKEQNIWSHSQP